ncbi:MAG: hypothetical protein R2827_15265 [Bdellovibrionales bacterium]
MFLLFCQYFASAQEGIKYVKDEHYEFGTTVEQFYLTALVASKQLRLVWLSF